MFLCVFFFVFCFCFVCLFVVVVFVVVVVVVCVCVVVVVAVVVFCWHCCHHHICSLSLVWLYFFLLFFPGDVVRPKRS